MVKVIQHIALILVFVTVFAGIMFAAHELEYGYYRDESNNEIITDMYADNTPNQFDFEERLLEEIYSTQHETYTSEQRVRPLWNHVIMGDVDGDGRVTSADATALARYLIGHDVTIDYRAADVVLDGNIDLRDLTQLVSALMGFGTLGRMPQHNMRYRIAIDLSSSGMSGTAQNLVDDLAPAFRNSILNVHLITAETRTSTSILNMRPDCNYTEINDICDDRCNPIWVNLFRTRCRDYHHRSLSHFLNEYKSTNLNINTFRFVGYRLCVVLPQGSTNHYEIHGAVDEDGRRDMIVSIDLFGN